MKRLAVLLCMYTIMAHAQQKNLDDYYQTCPFTMPLVAVPVFPAKDFNVKDFGAVANGKTLNTKAFAKAIEACSNAGGGNVIIPAGEWLTGPIEMKSNVNLVAQKGALVQFTKDHTQYPIVKSSNTSSNYTTASPIYGYDLKNIAITGEGIFDGAGDTWRPVKKMKTTDAQWNNLIATGVLSDDKKIWWPSNEAMNGENYLKTLKLQGRKLTAEDYLPARDYLRPYMVYFVNCENVLIDGVTLRNSPKFIFYPNYCTNVTLRNATFFNEWWAQNGDAIDISGCKNVVIYHCDVNAGDDGICLKSSREKSDVSNEATMENILIAQNKVRRAHGGFVIGSNTDGGIKNVFVSDCNFIGTDVGIRVKSNSGRGGLVHNIYVDNITMKDMVNEAVSFDTYYEDVPAGKEKTVTTSRDKVPEFKDFYISNVFCDGAKTAISITGLPYMPVHDIHFNNVSIVNAGAGFVSTDAANIELKKVKIQSSSPIYNINNTSGLHISEAVIPGNGNVRTFLKAEGKVNDIKIHATNLSGVKNITELGKGIDKSAVSVD